MPEAPSLAAPSISQAASEAAAMGGGGGTSSGKTGSNMDSAFANLEKFGKAPTPEPNTIPPHPSQKNKAEQPAAKTEEPPKQPESKTEPAKEPKDETLDPAKPAVDPTKPKKPADFLREKLQKTETERDTFKAELEKLKTAQPTEHPEIKTLNEQLEALRKEKTHLEEEFRYVKYEKSPEYAEKFVKPYNEAWNRGRQMIARLKTTDAEGNSVAATAEQFDRLMEVYLQDPESAATQLEQMFGPRAALITPHMLEVEKAAIAGTNAVAEYRKSGAEREKQWQESSAKVQKEVAQHWQESIKPEAVPDQWKPYVLPKGTDKDGNPIDKEGDDLLAKGLATFDKAAQENVNDPRMTSEQRKAAMGRAAAIRNKAAAFPRLIRDLKAREAEIAELKKSLESFQKSEPGAGEGKGGEKKGQGPAADTMEGALGALDRKATPKFY